MFFAFSPPDTLIHKTLAYWEIENIGFEKLSNIFLPKNSNNTLKCGKVTHAYKHQCQQTPDQLEHHFFFSLKMDSAVKLKTIRKSHNFNQQVLKKYLN